MVEVEGGCVRLQGKGLAYVIEGITGARLLYGEHAEEVPGTRVRSIRLQDLPTKLLGMLKGTGLVSPQGERE